MNAQLHAIAESISANTFSFMQNGVAAHIILVTEYSGEDTHWKVLLTTDTSMNFVRAFELYQRRWGIEVIFKECRGYLWTGKMSESELQCSDCRHHLVFHDVPDVFPWPNAFQNTKPWEHYSVPSVTGCKCLPCGAGLWKKSGICWKFCRVKQEWICWHAYQL